MSLEPIVEFYDIDTDKQFTDAEGDEWQVGTVKAGESSDELNLRIWNNRGGNSTNIDSDIATDGLNLEEGKVTFASTHTGDVIADYEHEVEQVVNSEVLDEEQLTATATSGTVSLTNWGDTTIEGGDDDIYNIEIIFTDTASAGSESTAFDDSTSPSTLTVDLASGNNYTASAIQTLITDSSTANTPYGFDWSTFTINVTNDVEETATNLVSTTFTLSGGKDINNYFSSVTKTISEINSAELTITGNSHENSDLTVLITDTASSGSETSTFDDTNGEITLDLAGGTAYGASDLQSIIQTTDNTNAPDGVDFSTWTIAQSISGETATGTELAAYSFNLQGGQDGIIGQKFNFNNGDLVQDSIDLYIQSSLVPSGDIVEMNLSEGYVDLERSSEITDDVTADYEYFTGSTEIIEDEVLIDSGDAKTFIFNNSNLISGTVTLSEGGDASMMKDCKLFVTASEDQFIVDQGWVESYSPSLGETSTDRGRLYDTDIQRVGSETFYSSDGQYRIDGKTNDGTDTNVDNYSDVNLRVSPISNAPHGEHKFNVVVEYFYT